MVVPCMRSHVAPINTSPAPLSVACRLHGFAKKMADQFFSNLQTTLEGDGESAAEQGDAPAEKLDDEKKRRWFGKKDG